MIIRRYLAHSRALAQQALSQLAPEEDDSVEAGPSDETEPKRKPLNAQRRAAGGGRRATRVRPP